jgi:peroxiredoxin
MPHSDDFYRLPADLPVPVDDGACAHLPGMALPGPLPLPATTGGTVELAALPGRTVVYCYPRTGRPGVPTPDSWNAIPGARGCTPQTCAFRDHYSTLRGLGVAVYGLSTQTGEYQREAAERLHLPFALLSDAGLAFATALRLPTFSFDGLQLLKRVTLILRDGHVEHVFYPVFPPDANAAEVADWLQAHPLADGH